jgi:hypothetical protein
MLLIKPEQVINAIIAIANPLIEDMNITSVTNLTESNVEDGE